MREREKTIIWWWRKKNGWRTELKANKKELITFYYSRCLSRFNRKIWPVDDNEEVFKVKYFMKKICNCSLSYELIEFPLEFHLIINFHSVGCFFLLLVDLIWNDDKQIRNAMMTNSKKKKIKKRGWKNRKEVGDDGKSVVLCWARKIK